MRAIKLKDHDTEEELLQEKSSHLIASMLTIGIFDISNRINNIANL